MKTFGPAPTAASLGLRSSVSECMSLPVKDVEDGADDAGILDLNGIDEVEIDNVGYFYCWCNPNRDCRKTVVQFALEASS